jgi:hypothetical protein
MYSYEKLARILRTDKDAIRILGEKLESVTGRKNVMEKIAEENRAAIASRLGILGIDNPNTSAKEIYDALIKKLETDDTNLYKVLGEPKATSSKDWDKILKTSQGLISPPMGFFLKKEKAEEFLKNQPPMRVVRSLGYRNIDELIANENFLEIFSSLRFIEGGEWLSNTFFKQYESLKPTDFEEREIVPLAIPEKWSVLAQEFIQEKHHNISHLKELGVIYVIPLSLEITGETLRNFSLILHYFNEITFYSDIFRKLAQDEKTFAQNVISLLRGDVIDERLSPSAGGLQKSQWLIIQRYLAKGDQNDWRLFEPHINPEALHWERAERQLLMISRELKGFTGDLSFWHDLNWVGDYFKSDTGIDVLVSFNLVDVSMSLVKKKELVKYLYHNQESLWNKIFMEYFDEEKMEQTIKENIFKGWFEV